VYKNNGGLNAADAYAAQDTSYNIGVNTIFRIRFEVANTSSNSGTLISRLEFKEDSGAWTEITTNSNNVHLAISSFFTDGAATTSRLTSTGSFVPGQGKDTSSDTSVVSLGASSYTEDEYAIILEASAAGHSYQFRITNAGTPLDNYVVFPSINNPDSTPPVQSNFNPAAGTILKTTTPIVTFSLDENGDCRLSTTDESYGGMLGGVTCYGAGGTFMACFVPNLGSNGPKTIYTACEDVWGNKDTTATAHSTTYSLNINSSSSLIVGGNLQVRGGVIVK